MFCRSFAFPGSVGTRCYIALMTAMQSLSAADLLNLWEQGAGLHAIDQALLVLDHALPGHSSDYLTKLPLGERDALLFQVHRRSFGDKLDAFTECSECREGLEFSLSCDLLSSCAMHAEVSAKTVTIQGIEFSLRCPNSRDAAAAAASETVEAAKKNC